MIRRSPRFALTIGALVVAMLALAACQASPPPTPDVSSPVDGIVVSVESEGLGDVRGFSLRPVNSPFAFDFVIGSLENPTDFPPSHLAEHQASSSPVRAWFRVENGERVVYRLEDAPES